MQSAGPDRARRLAVPAASGRAIGGLPPLAHRILLVALFACAFCALSAVAAHADTAHGDSGMTRPVAATAGAVTGTPLVPDALRTVTGAVHVVPPVSVVGGATRPVARRLVTTLTPVIRRVRPVLDTARTVVAGQRVAVPPVTRPVPPVAGVVLPAAPALLVRGRGGPAAGLPRVILRGAVAAQGGTLLPVTPRRIFAGPAPVVRTATSGTGRPAAPLFPPLRADTRDAPGVGSSAAWPVLLAILAGSWAQPVLSRAGLGAVDPGPPRSRAGVPSTSPG